LSGSIELAITADIDVAHDHLSWLRHPR